MKINKTVVISLLLIVLALVGGFFAGMHFQRSRPTSFTGGFMTGANQSRGRFGGAGNQAMRPVRGQVISVDANGLTVKLPDGSSKIVVVSGSTTFAKSQQATKSDAAAGDSVMVVGTQNSDGSVTAQNIMISSVAASPTPTGTK